MYLVRLLKHVSLCVVTVLLIACSAAATPSPDTGIEGQVLIGPMCPVVQPGTPCPDQPYQATIAVLDKNGRPVTQFQSDAQGRFLVSLAPGTYTLRPGSSDGITRAGEQTVAVVSGQYTQVTITYDSGIR